MNEVILKTNGFHLHESRETMWIHHMFIHEESSTAALIHIELKKLDVLEWGITKVEIDI